MTWPFLFFSAWAATTCPVTSTPDAVPSAEMFEAEVRKACRTLPESIGTYQKKDDSGTIRVSGECLQGLPNRSWRLFGPKGDLLFDWTFKKGERNGSQISCAADGSRTESNYREGERHGPARVFDPSGQLVGELVFVDDDLAWVRLVKSGDGWKEIQVGRGAEPTRITRIEHGSKVFDRVSLAGEPGRQHEIRWYPEKGMESEGDLADGKPDGRWIYWDKAGKLVAVRVWKAGIKVSDQTENCPDGKIEDALVKCGEWTYTANGRTVSHQEIKGFVAWDTGVDEQGTFWREERRYDSHSQLVQRRRFEDGIQVLEASRPESRKGKMRATRWHRTGMRAAEGAMDSSGEHEEGIWIYWNELGERIAKRRFQHGVVKEETHFRAQP